MSLIDKAKHMVFEEEDKPKVVVHNTTQTSHGPVGPTTVTTGPISTGTAYAQTIVSGSSIYNDLKAKTDFDTTDTGKVIQGYLAALAGVSMDEATRLKVAIQMAGHKEGLKPQAITDTLDSLSSTLEGEKVKFEKSGESFSQRIADDNKSLQQLQAQIADLQNRITTEQAKLKSTKDEFTVAYQTRMAEINQQREHYESLLKG